MINPDDGIRIIAPLAFKAADKFFKFVTWAFALAALHFAVSVTGSTPLRWTTYLATSVYSTTLLLQAFYIGMRDPSTLNIPESWYGVSRATQVVVALALLFALTSPALYLDQMFDALAQARPR